MLTRAYIRRERFKAQIVAAEFGKLLGTAFGGTGGDGRRQPKGVRPLPHAKKTPGKAYAPAKAPARQPALRLPAHKALKLLGAKAPRLRSAPE